jgi:uncharacterized protein (TIGR02594 family)
MPRYWRHALACAFLCLLAGCNAASAASRYRGAFEPPLADDGGRAWRAVSSLAAGAWSGGARVVAEAERFLGSGNPTGTRGPWCADYVSWTLRHVGRRPLANRLAASALRYGPHVRDPRPGDLVVMNTRRGYARHVGFFAGWDRGRVVLVSGNWGHRVVRALVSPRAIAAFVRV